MMTAIHLLNYFQYGGGENVALNYCRALSQIGCRTIVVAKDRSLEYKEMISTYCDEVQPALTRTMVERCDIIFVHTNIALLKLFKYRRILKRNRVKVCYIQHLNYPENKFKILSKFINHICTDFIQITPVTDDLVGRYIKIKVNFIVNFNIPSVDRSSYPAVRDRIRRECGIAEDKIAVLFSGVLKPGKNIALFVELADRFKESNDYHFVVVGDGSEAKFVESYSGKNLTWTGFVNNVEDYIIASDIYCFTSSFEMMPMAVIEAINCDKPIVSTDIPATRFLLDRVYGNIDEMEGALREWRDLKVSSLHYDLVYGVKQLNKLFGK